MNNYKFKCLLYLSIYVNAFILLNNYLVNGLSPVTLLCGRRRLLPLKFLHIFSEVSRDMRNICLLRDKEAWKQKQIVNSRQRAVIRKCLFTFELSVIALVMDEEGFFVGVVGYFGCCQFQVTIDGENRKPLS